MKYFGYGLGALLVLTGLVWMGQGSGLFPYPAESFMIDQRPWIFAGAAAVVIGLALLLLTVRRRR